MSPARAGLPSDPSRRRVPGLRRAEVAILAGISVDYYIQLEQGQAGRVSESVLAALAQALQLDEAERSYLLNLVEAPKVGASSRSRGSVNQVRPVLLHVLDTIAVPGCCVTSATISSLPIALAAACFRLPWRAMVNRSITPASCSSTQRRSISM